MIPHKYLRGISQKIARIQREKNVEMKKVRGPPGRIYQN